MGACRDEEEVSAIPFCTGNLFSHVKEAFLATSFLRFLNIQLYEINLTYLPIIPSVSNLEMILDFLLV